MLSWFLSILALSSLAFASGEDARDARRFPHTMSFLKGMRMEKAGPVTYGNEHLIHAAQVSETSPGLWDQFFKSAAADHLTILRAFGLLAREFKNRGVSVFGPGTGF